MVLLSLGFRICLNRIVVDIFDLVKHKKTKKRLPSFRRPGTEQALASGEIEKLR